MFLPPVLPCHEVCDVPKIIILFLLLTFSAQAMACVMEPSIWEEVEVATYSDGPGIYSLTEAFCQIKQKFAAEMTACALPVGPITFVGGFYGASRIKLSSEQIAVMETAVAVVWKDASVVKSSDMLDSMDNFDEFERMAKKLQSGYAASVHIVDSRSSAINLIDVNFNLYSLFRLVFREEARVYIRITDNSGNAVFLDEVSVSPTIIVDPLVSPIGGFFIRFEKNTSFPLVADFGPLYDGGPHELRLNNAYRQPMPVPPLREFKLPPSGSVIEKN